MFHYAYVSLLDAYSVTSATLETKMVDIDFCCIFFTKMELLSLCCICELPMVDID